jgi:uncharacterized membrane protein SpoIIM required for sporulation
MIIDLHKFIAEERPFWSELEEFLDIVEKEPERRLDLFQVERFHYLYQRAANNLAKISTFSAERNTRLYLESLVGRAYGEIHETREKPHRLRLFHWFFNIFPQTFRKHIRAFWISLIAMMVGAAFGGFAIVADSSTKQILLPFSHLQGDPSERVKEEESVKADRLKGAKTTFSSFLMTHNTKIAIFTLALGMTWGIGTLIMLFYNGVILGAVAVDYVLAGETSFLLGWLLPHGVVEISAILLAGQAGIVLAGALIGWGKSISLRMRLRKISQDLVTLIFGIMLMLVWAGIVEAYFSQYHEPVIPYEFKIAFGLLEFAILTVFLARSGSKKVKVNRLKQ